MVLDAYLLLWVLGPLGLDGVSIVYIGFVEGCRFRALKLERRHTGGCSNQVP